MITLTGILRQAGQVRIQEKDRLKLVVEHETPRDNGLPDLRLETLFLAPQDLATLPRTGEVVHVEVRPYPVGKGIAFAGVRVLVAESADSLVAV